MLFFFFSSRRRHTRCGRDWSSDVCSSDLAHSARMVGDETMRAEWALGKVIGQDLLTIIDDGNILGSGYTPYDDEGTRARKTYIIKDGKLRARQIGRASCRERVRITGGSGSFKRKRMN